MMQNKKLFVLEILHRRLHGYAGINYKHLDHKHIRRLRYIVAECQARRGSRVWLQPDVTSHQCSIYCTRYT